MYAALIIDADADAQFAIQNAFCDDPIDFRCANSAQDGIEAAAGAKTDLVLVRIELPTSSGFSVFSKLRRNPSTKNIPVVLYASDVADDVFTRHASLRTHAEGYLRLPIEGAELHSLIRPLLALPEPQQASPAHSLDVQLQDSQAAAPPADSPWDGAISQGDVDSMLDSLETSEQADNLEFELDEVGDDPTLAIELSSADALAHDDLEITADDVDLDFAPIEDVALAGQAPHPPQPEAAEIIDSGPALPPVHNFDEQAAQAEIENFESAPPTSTKSEEKPEPVTAAKDEQATQATDVDADDAKDNKEVQAETAQLQPPSSNPAPLKMPSLSPRAASDAIAPPPRKMAAPQMTAPATAVATLRQPEPTTASSEPAAAPEETPPPPTAVSNPSPSQPAIDLNAERAQAQAPTQPAANLQALQPKPLASEPPKRNENAPRSERRELLALKNQLLDKDRELLALREELESFEQKSLEQKKAQRGQQSQLAELQAAQLKSEEANLVAQEQIETLQAELASLKAEQDSRQDELKAAQAKCGELETELASLQEQTQNQEAKLKEADEERQTAQSERELAQNRVEELEREASESTARIQALEKEMQERDTTLRSRDEQLQDAQASLSGLLDRLKAS